MVCDFKNFTDLIFFGIKFAVAKYNDTQNQEGEIPRSFITKIFFTNDKKLNLKSKMTLVSNVFETNITNLA
jgi:hypothetical protein